MGDVLLPDTSGSYCGDGTFATGVTVWSSDGFVYGIVLECAYLTATCAPPNYPANLLEGTPLEMLKCDVSKPRQHGEIPPLP